MLVRTSHKAALHNWEHRTARQVPYLCGPSAGLLALGSSLWSAMLAASPGLAPGRAFASRAFARAQPGQMSMRWCFGTGAGFAACYIFAAPFISTSTRTWPLLPGPCRAHVVPPRRPISCPCCATTPPHGRDTQSAATALPSFGSRALALITKSCCHWQPPPHVLQKAGHRRAGAMQYAPCRHQGGSFRMHNYGMLPGRQACGRASAAPSCKTQVLGITGRERVTIRWRC